MDSPYRSERSSVPVRAPLPVASRTISRPVVVSKTTVSAIRWPRRLRGPCWVDEGEVAAVRGRREPADPAEVRDAGEPLAPRPTVQHAVGEVVEPAGGVHHGVRRRADRVGPHAQVQSSPVANTTVPAGAARGPDRQAVPGGGGPARRLRAPGPRRRPRTSSDLDGARLTPRGLGETEPPSWDRAPGARHHGAMDQRGRGRDGDRSGAGRGVPGVRRAGGRAGSG